MRRVRQTKRRPDDDDDDDDDELQGVENMDLDADDEEEEEEEEEEEADEEEEEEEDEEEEDTGFVAEGEEDDDDDDDDEEEEEEGDDDGDKQRCTIVPAMDDVVRNIVAVALVARCFSSVNGCFGSFAVWCMSNEAELGEYRRRVEAGRATLRSVETLLTSPTNPAVRALPRFVGTDVDVRPATTTSSNGGVCAISGLTNNKLQPLEFTLSLHNDAQTATPPLPSSSSSPAAPME